MSAAEQYMDPEVLDSLDRETRVKIDKYFQLGVKQVEAKLASVQLERAKADLANAEKFHGIRTRVPLIKSDLLK